MHEKLAMHKRIVVLTEGKLGLFTSKTAAAVLRYRREDVVAVLDSTKAGEKIEQWIPWAEGVPIVGSMTDAMGLKPDALLVGVATIGGLLPEGMREHIVEALKAGVDVISGMHVMLGEDSELGALAAKHGGKIWDVRDTGGFGTVASGKAAGFGVKRVLTVGTDCVVGKMVASLELAAEAKKQGLNSAFVPTGQTGIMIAGWGISVDRVISDFTNGSAEWLVEQVADRDICFVEGQGSIAHPGYSAVTVGLMHGSCPDAIVMCHRPGRDSHIDMEVPMVPLMDQIQITEQLASMVHPTKVVGLTVNTGDMEEDDARRAIDEVSDLTGMPAVDVIRESCEPLVKAVRGAVGI